MLDNDKEAEANLKITLTPGKYGQAAYFNEEYLNSNCYNCDNCLKINNSLISEKYDLNQLINNNMS